MTTIAYRDGTMAADSRGYAGNCASLGTKSKIRKCPDGTLVGCSSNKPGQTEAVMAWFMAGADLSKVPDFGAIGPDFTLLVVRADGTALYGDGLFHLSGPLTAPFFAVGSGRGPAYGAMEMGASAQRAVEVACLHDVWSGGPIETLQHRMASDFSVRQEFLNTYLLPEHGGLGANCRTCGIRLDNNMGYVCQSVACPHFPKVTC